MPMLTATSAELTVGDVKKSVASLTGSVSYLKTLIPIAACNIISNRIKYDPYLFDTHTLEETQYKTFSKRVPKKHDLFNVYHWLKNAMKDINRKYLKQLYLIIRDKETKDVIEFYCFSVKYAEQKQTTPWETVFESTAKIFQAINLLSDLQMLDNTNISFAMQVVFNESAPESYTTPSFNRGIPYVNSEVIGTISLGSLSTGHHKLKIRANGNIFNVEEEEETEENNTNCEIDPQKRTVDNKNTILTETSCDDASSKKLKITLLQDMCLKKPNEHNDGVKEIKMVEKNNIIDKGDNNKRNMRTRRIIKNKEKSNLPLSTKRPRKVRCKAKKIDDEVGSEDFFEPSKKMKVTNKSDNIMEKKEVVGDLMESPKIECLCGITNLIATLEYISCDNCGTFQHCVCVGYKSVLDVPKIYICYACHVITGKKLSDVRMSTCRNQIERQIFTIARLLSFYCQYIKNSPSILLDQIPENGTFVDDLKKSRFIYEKNGEYICDMDKTSKILEGTSFYKSDNILA